MLAAESPLQERPSVAMSCYAKKKQQASPHGVGSRATAGIRAGNELRTGAGAVAQTLRPTTPIHRVGHTSPGPDQVGAPRHPQTPALTPFPHHHNIKDNQQTKLRRNLAFIHCIATQRTCTRAFLPFSPRFHSHRESIRLD